MLRTTFVEDYIITGNKYIAIAVNKNDEKDSHYFDIDPDVNNDAYIRACAWAYVPTDEDYKKLENSVMALSKLAREARADV